MNMRAFFILFLIAMLTPLAQGQTCLSVPPDSPILSYSPDDVPPASNEILINVSGQAFNGRPNHQLAYVQTGPNEQKVWFSIDVHFENYDKGSVYYNRRYRANASSPWYWQYSYSIPITNPNPPIGFVDAVLYSPTPRYGRQNVYTEQYKYVMYTVNQPSSCNGTSGGYAMVSYSNDGVCWPVTVPMHRWGGPSSPCTQLGTDLVPVEAVGAIDSGTNIYLMGMEGDNTWLAHYDEMDKTHTAWGYSDPHAADVVWITPDVDVSGYGLFTPDTLPETDWQFPHRYLVYNYFFNMAIAWDAASGDLYVTRAYPHPYDRSTTPEMNYGYTTVPGWSQQYNSIDVYNPYVGAYQSVSDCGATSTFGLAVYPNRYQIYKMHLGDLGNFSYVHYGYWTLLADRGNSVGYTASVPYTNYSNAPLVYGQSAGNRDAGAASFIRDGSGQLVRTNGTAYVLSGNTLREHLSVGPCQTTGNERVLLEAVPGISVVAGTYGGNCGTSHGNVTGALGSACNTLGHCDYIVDYTILGDPAPGCAKDYVAEWTCNGQSLVQRATASPEAGFRKTVTLVCP